jgi:putative transposase
LHGRGLEGVQLVISDAHTGLHAAIGKVFGCRWQRCTINFLRDMLGHVARAQQPLVSGAIRGIFTAGSAAEARERLGQVVDQLRPHAPKVAGLLENAEADLLAFYGFPAEHWSTLRSTNPLERVNREIGRGSDVVGIFPNDAALPRLAGMLLLEQNNEWLVSRRYLSESSMTLVLATTAQDHHTEGKEVPELPEHDRCEPSDDQQLHHLIRLDSGHNCNQLDRTGRNLGPT